MVVLLPVVFIFCFSNLDSLFPGRFGANLIGQLRSRSDDKTVFFATYWDISSEVPVVDGVSSPITKWSTNSVTGFISASQLISSH